MDGIDSFEIYSITASQLEELLLCISQNLKKLSSVISRV